MNELVIPITVGLTYCERWIRKKIDLLELVTLRESGLTLREIALRFGVCKSTVLRTLYPQVPAKGGMRGRLYK